MATISAPFSTPSLSYSASKPSADACGMTARVTPKFVPISKVSFTPGTKATITAQAQENVFLKFLLLDASSTGYVNDIKIGNQSLNCSDSSIDLQLLAYNSQRMPMIGVAVDGNIQASIDITMDGVGAQQVIGGFSCEAIDKAPTLTAQCDALNKFFGMGSVTVSASSSAQLSAQALRDCTLSDLVLANHSLADVKNTELRVTDITVAGRSVFSGQAADSLGFSVFSEEAQKLLESFDVEIQTNQRVIITVANDNGTKTATVGGGFFVR